MYAIWSEDDDDEPRRDFEIQAELGGRTCKFVVPAAPANRARGGDTQCGGTCSATADPRITAGYGHVGDMGKRKPALVIPEGVGLYALYGATFNGHRGILPV